MQSWAEILSLWQNKKVLVTGAAGFLGSHLCYELLEAGANVTLVDDFSAWTKLPDKPVLNGLILPVRIQDDEIHSLLSKTAFDVIFHLAGLAYAAKSVTSPWLDFESNLLTTVQFLDVLRKNSFQGRLVYTSSAAVYGQPDRFPIDENTATLPISPYGVSKLSAEHYIRVYSNLYNFQALIARPFSLYGCRQRKQVVYDIVRKALQSDGAIELIGDGSEVRDFLYVEDAARALLYLGACPSNDIGIFNICSGQGISIQELAQMIINILGEDTNRICFTGVRRPGDPLIWVGCNRLLIQTGFYKRFDLERGLKLTVNWCREHL